MIGDLVKDLAQKQQETRQLLGEVVAIDKSKRTCDVEPNNGDATVLDVQLQGLIAYDKGFYLLPKKGSQVSVMMFDDHVGCVVQTSEIESMECVVEGKTLSISKKGVSIKSATSSLKSEINTLLDEIDALYDLIVEPGLFVAGSIPVIISPTATLKLVQKKAKIKQLKTAFNSFLTD